MYAIKGLCLISSLEQHVKDYTLYVLALDEVTANYIASLDNPKLVVIRDSTIKEVFPKLEAVCRTRSTGEWCFTLTPYLLSYVMAIYNPPDLAYIDSDCYFLSSPDPLYDEKPIHRLDSS
jgi:hypothetical protein